MEKTDLSFIAALTPKIEAGAISKNIDSIVECVSMAADNGAKIAVLPLNILLGDLGRFNIDTFGGALDSQIKNGLEALRQKLSICCVFALDYGEYKPVIIENGQIHFSDIHLTSEGKYICIAKSFSDSLGAFNLPKMNSMLGALKIANITPDIIAVPSSYGAFIKGAERVLPLIADLSKQTGATVVCASNGNGNSAYKFVRSADKIIAHNGIIAGYLPSDADDCLHIHSTQNSSDSCPTSNCSSNRISDLKNIETADVKALEESWIPPDMNEVFDIVTRGIYSRMSAAKAKKLVLGLSGGLDSTCALISAVRTADKYGFDRKNIIAVRMPTKESSCRTKSNGEKTARLLDVDSPEIPVSVDFRLKRINHDKIDVVYENAQARERAGVLLDLANKENALVLGTSDLTEIALGFSTYGGDQLAHYNPNAGLTKLAIRSVVAGFALNCGDKQLQECLQDILDTPYSPELKPGQASEQILGPYEVFEFFLLRLLAYKESKDEILAKANKAFSFGGAQIQKYYETFIKRFISGRFKHNFSCDGIALFPFDLSLIELNCDLNPEFLL